MRKIDYSFKMNPEQLNKIRTIAGKESMAISVVMRKMFSFGIKNWKEAKKESD